MLVYRPAINMKAAVEDQVVEGDAVYQDDEVDWS